MTGKMLSRRQFLRDAGVAAALASVPVATADVARARRIRRATVAVLGGGVAGLTAAHELAERGFRVDVYERRALGGKARSMSVPGTAAGGRRPLPGEHAFRSFFGLYRNLPDTLRRIPVAGAHRSVHDNLAATSALTIARAGGREDIVLPLIHDSQPQPLTVDDIAREVASLAQTFGAIPPSELAFFVRQLAIFFTSSDERRLGEFERISWWDYTRAERMSVEYRKLVNLVPRAVALRPRLSSARSVAMYWQNGLSFVTGEGQQGGADQVLTAPTNEAWIVPWARYLRSHGVRFWRQSVEGLSVVDGRIVAARVRDSHGRRRTITADWFVCALPVERARRLWSPAVLAADPALERTNQIQTITANGMQFYLRREVSFVHGHYFCIDSPWALGAVTHAQFWRQGFAATYGDGHVKDSLSMYISEFDEPGILYGKPARSCTPDEFAREVWAQLKAHLEDTGKSYLPDDILHAWFIDPGLHLPGNGRRTASSDDELYLTSVGSWENRPGPATAIPNLFIAGDYTQTTIDAATMEGANESGRKAVNALLKASGATAEPVPILPLYRFPEFEPARRLDADRYRDGQPHILDTPWPGPTDTGDPR